MFSGGFQVKLYLKLSRGNIFEGNFILPLNGASLGDYLLCRINAPGERTELFYN